MFVVKITLHFISSVKSLLFSDIVWTELEAQHCPSDLRLAALTASHTHTRGDAQWYRQSFTLHQMHHRYFKLREVRLKLLCPSLQSRLVSHTSRLSQLAHIHTEKKHANQWNICTTAFCIQMLCTVWACHFPLLLHPCNLSLSEPIFCASHTHTHFCHWLIFNTINLTQSFKRNIKFPQMHEQLPCKNELSFLQSS